MKRMKMFKPVLCVLILVILTSMMASMAFAAGPTVVGFSSEHPGQYSATLAVDGDDFTFWSTEYEPIAKAPHWITFDLGATFSVTGFKALPRQDGYAGVENGNIGEYNVYTSMDNATFTKIYSGSFDAAASTEQVATFGAAEARYVKIESPSGEYMGIANITFDGTQIGDAAPANPKTGDTGSMPYVLLALMSAVGFMVIRKVRLHNK